MILLYIYFDFQQLRSNIPFNTTEHEICPTHLKVTVAVVKHIPATLDVCLFCIKYVPLIRAFIQQNLSESTTIDVQYCTYNCSYCNNIYFDDFEILGTA
jgi:hypothetical protein